MITPSDGGQRPDAGKGAMEIDWPDPAVNAHGHAHPGHSAPVGVECANLIFRDRLFTVRGA
jgi:hypothetical protein